MTRLIVLNIVRVSRFFKKLAINICPHKNEFLFNGKHRVCLDCGAFGSQLEDK